MKEEGGVSRRGSREGELSSGGRGAHYMREGELNRLGREGELRRGEKGN